VDNRHPTSDLGISLDGLARSTSTNPSFSTMSFWTFYWSLRREGFRNDRSPKVPKLRDEVTAVSFVVRRIDSMLQWPLRPWLWKWILSAGLMIRAGNAPMASTESHMQCLKSKFCRFAVSDTILKVGQSCDLFYMPRC